MGKTNTEYKSKGQLACDYLNNLLPGWAKRSAMYDTSLWLVLRKVGDDSMDYVTEDELVEYATARGFTYVDPTKRLADVLNKYFDGIVSGDGCFEGTTRLLIKVNSYGNTWKSFTPEEFAGRMVSLANEILEVE
jgi:hypothetical protein